MKDLAKWISIGITILLLILGGVKGYAILQENVKDLDGTTKGHSITLDKHDARLRIQEMHAVKQTAQLDYIGEGIREQKTVNKEIIKAIMELK